MNSEKETITIRVNVEIPPAALETIVGTVREMAGRNVKGHYQVDTADAVGTMISRFLAEKGFEAFVGEPAHYAGLLNE